MVVTENYRVREDGVQLVKSFSDCGNYIRKGGAVYEEAVEPADLAMGWEDTGLEIPTEIDAETALAALLDVLNGDGEEDGEDDDEEE